MDYSSLITVGGTSQLAAANKGDRTFLRVQNVSANDMWCRFGQAAAVNSGILIKAGQTAEFYRATEPQITQKIYILGATTNDRYTMQDDSLDM